MTPTLTIDNSYSRISGLPDRTFEALRKLLSYRVQTFNARFPSVRHCLSKRGEFPTGLLSKVQVFLNAHNAEFRTIDKRRRPRLFQVPLNYQNAFKPHEWQLKATTIVSKHPRAGVVAATGSGKSLAMAMIVEKLKVRTLIVVPSLEIKRQLTETFVHLFGRGVTKYVTISNVDSVKPDDYDLLIIDECHHAASKTYRNLNKKAWNSIYYRYFFSATFFRNDKDEQLLFEGVCGEVRYELTYKDAVKAGYVVPVDAFYVDLPKRDVEGYTWAQVYREAVTGLHDRNVIIAELLTTLDTAGASTLCLVKEVAHGETLSLLSGIPFASGRDDGSRDYIRQFNAGAISTLIATTGVMGEGVDTKPCEYVILAGLGKAKSSIMQQVGRCVRVCQGKTSGKVILFRDRSHRFLSRHYNAEKAILTNEYGAKPKKLEGI